MARTKTGARGARGGGSGQRGASAPEETLRIEYVPLGDLKRWPRNPKEHDLGTIGASLRRFGMVETPVLDERTGRLVAGHGRLEQLEAERNARLAPPRRIQVREGDGEWMVPVLRGVSFRDEREAEAYLVASNETTIKGGWNERELAVLLGDLTKQGDDALVGTGFTDEEVRTMLASLAASELGSRSGAPEDFPEFKDDSKKTVACPKCGFHVVVD